jgi:hypothetical protein
MYSLFSSLLNRVVMVQADKLKMLGRLRGFSESRSGPDHRPEILVLETADGLVIIREWTVIAFGRES